MKGDENDDKGHNVMYYFLRKGVMNMAKNRAHGEGHIRKRVDGRWEGIFTAAIDADGKQQFKHVYGKTRKQVADKLRELARQKELYGFVSTKKVSVAEWIEHWLKEIMVHSLRQTTYRTYESLFNTHIKPSLGSLLLQKLTPADIQKLYNRLAIEGKRIQVKKPKAGEEAPPPPAPQGLSSSAIRQVHQVIRGSLEKAAKDGLIIRNPALHVKLPRRERKEHQVKAFSEDEIKKLLASIQSDRLRYAYVLELKTGIRRGELLGLTWEAIDWENKTINIKQSLVYAHGEVCFSEPKTTKGRRILEVEPEVLADLKRQKALQAEERLKAGPLWQDNNLVFAKEDGQPINPNGFTRRFRRLIERLGIKGKRFHDLRHTFASLLILAGEDILRVSEFLGHAKAGFTLNTYSHVLPGKKRDTAKKINNIIEGLKTQT